MANPNQKAAPKEVELQEAAVLNERQLGLIAGLEADRAALIKSQALLKAQLDVVLASRSWRFTAFFRRLTQAARRVSDALFRFVRGDASMVKASSIEHSVDVEVCGPAVPDGGAKFAASFQAPPLEEHGPDPRLLAFYLPQYHPIPENDRFWGKGFTEWRNVSKAVPFFNGHYQPRLPGELGHYDLRVSDILEQQAALAKQYGVHGFCYYFYWFQGRRLLNLPVDNMLRSKRPDLPFCFCWANENWTRRWDGMEQEILIAQRHTSEDDLRFIRHLLPAFEDSRYIRVNGRPLLLIYRTELFPNPTRTAEVWRNEVRKAGFGDLYLVRCEGFDPWTNPEDIGYDASYEVPTFILPDELLCDQVAKLNVPPQFQGRLFDYEKIVKFYSEREDTPYKRFKDVMLAWDNTPRHGPKATIFHGATPALYRRWLANAIAHAKRRFHGEERLVFINAWNEWAEGSYLDPDLKFGRSYLEATKAALHRESFISDAVPQEIL